MRKATDRGFGIDTAERARPSEVWRRDVHTTPTAPARQFRSFLARVRLVRVEGERRKPAYWLAESFAKLFLKL